MPSEEPVSLPSEEELAQLPPRAIVAYAVRCARRVQPLCVLAWPDDEPNRGLLDGIEQALIVATEFARGVAPRPGHIAPISIPALADDDDGGHVARAAAGAASRAVRAAYAADARPPAGSAAHSAARAAAHSARATHSYGTAAVHRAARRDFELLLERFEKKPAAVRKSVSPSEHGFLGTYWHGEPPEWYTELKLKLDQSLRRSARAAADESVHEQLSEKRAAIDSLRGTLDDAKENAKRLEQQLEAGEERRGRTEAEVEELNQAFLDVQKERDEALHGRRESERELAESRSALDLQTTQPFRWYLDNVRTPESIFSFIGLFLLSIVVLMVLFGIGELRARQKLEMFLTSQISKLREQLADGATDWPEEANNDVATLDELSKHHGRLQTLTVSGADRESQTLPEIRKDVFVLHAAGPSGSTSAKDGPTNETAVFWVWPWRIPRYTSSDLLLALVVTMSGMVGAIVIVFRTGDRIVRPTDLAFGVAAGFITLLAIRGGKNVFLLQSEEVSFYLNPYSSAFFGLLAGLFTNDAFQVLRKFVRKFVVSLERTFELAEGDNGVVAKSPVPSQPDKASGRQETSEGPSRPPLDDEDDVKEDGPDG